MTLKLSTVVSRARLATRYSLLATALSLALSACGFHLRGAVTLPPEMTRTQIVGLPVHSELANEITDVLTGAGADVVGADDSAGAQLAITGERFDRRVASVDSSGKASQYELRYSLNGVLQEPGGEAMAPAQQVNITRLLDASSANALGTSSEEELLRREMRRDGVRQLIRQLRTALVHRTPKP